MPLHAQLIALQTILIKETLRFGAEVWQHHQLYLRTRSRWLPSEKTVRHVLAALVLKQLLDLPPNSLMAQIRRALLGTGEEEPVAPPAVA